jgi:outer membrane receptor for monomeric catechols
LTEVTVIDYEVPLISKDNTTSGASITAEEIAKLPNRSATGVASTVGGVYSADGEVGSIRGSREGAVTYIDGVKVIGNSSVPQGAIDQVDVILGGTPAMYGDAMGGIINVTTKGPSLLSVLVSSWKPQLKAMAATVWASASRDRSLRVRMLKQLCWVSSSLVTLPTTE